jgi:serine/threonine-protein kinase
MSAAAKADDFPKLEKYELCEEIGHGGMATVYRAMDLRLGREVAVKIIHRHLRDNAEVATRFVAEARAAAKLKHRGIVEVYDVSDEGDREKYLVVELVRGPTLRKLLVDHREMPAEVAAAIVCELCEATEHAHAAGVVHRDIKPENVLVELPDPTRPSKPSGRGQPADPEDPKVSGTRKESSRAGEDEPKDDGASAAKLSRAPRSQRATLSIKITDFGIAKILDAQGVTSTGQVLGSPAHMAPEQIEGGEVDPRTDVFALGVVLYEAMVGHLPFEGKNPAQVLRRVIEGQYGRAEVERPSVGSKYSRIVDHALATDPKDRLESPGGLAAALKAELEALGFADTRKEIAEFFESPTAYVEAHKCRVVPRLVARGEASRRARDPSGAACDFNRAHALAPDDLTILKRLTQLGAAGNRRRLAIRAGGLALGCVVLGTSAYGAARHFRAEAQGGPAAGASADAPAEARTDARSHLPKIVEDYGPSHTAAPIASSPPSAHVSASPRLSAELPARPAGSGGPDAVVTDTPRKVMFNVQPKSATLEVDGFVVDHMSATLLLKPGAHPVKLTPAPGDKSCDPTPLVTSVTVKPASPDHPDEVQRVPLAPPFRPAKVSVAGPAGGQVLCGNITLNVGATQEVTMSQPLFGQTCTFVGSGKESKGWVELKAGEANTVPWPKE